jgi:hypothetical protein
MPVRSKHRHSATESGCGSQYSVIHVTSRSPRTGYKW